MSLKSFKITIGRRIALGFLSMILFSVISSGITFLVLTNGIDKINIISNSVDPSIEALNEFNDLIVNTKMYSGNWVYQQANENDKKQLESIKDVQASQVKEKLLKYSQDWKIEEKEELKNLYDEYENLLHLINSDIMQTLVEFQDYNNPIITLEAADVIETKINPITEKLQTKLQVILQLKSEDSKIVKNAMTDSFVQLGYLILILTLITAVVAVFIGRVTSKLIATNVHRLQIAIQKLMKGEIPEKVNIKTKDEIGEMGNAINQLIVGLNSYSNFAQDIGNGNFNSSFDILGENDALGNSLLTMSANLQLASKEEKHRNWISEGITKISENLRLNNTNLEDLSSEVITLLVQYMEINQGGIFLADDAEQTDYKKTKLILTGCYAYDRLKLTHKEIIAGEGYVGQCWLEKEKIILKEVPQTYIKITSGLGESVPTSIFISPLKLNGQMFGVIELASFQPFNNFQVEFVEKICEVIAATVSSVKVAEKTQKLLLESKELTENLKSQEEELRQNHEEMMATQEESNRKYNETLQNLNELKAEKEHFVSEIETLKNELEKYKNK